MVFIILRGSVGADCWNLVTVFSSTNPAELAYASTPFVPSTARQLFSRQEAVSVKALLAEPNRER